MNQIGRLWMRVQRSLAVALAAILLASGSFPAPAEEVGVAVASSFTDAMRELVPRFERATGHTAKVSFGSTGKLFSQIEHGAPFSVYLAADGKRPAKAEQQGLAVPGTRFTYAKGRLVLWSPEPGVFEDGEAYLERLAFSRAAIANPSIAPYGLAARQVMEHLGVWAQARPKLVWGDNIAQTFQFVATANADVGFVAFSQVKAWQPAGGSLWMIPADYHAPIAQQAVLLEKGEDNPAARAFLAFLKTPEARRIIAGYGYAVE